MIVTCRYPLPHGRQNVACPGSSVVERKAFNLVVAGSIPASGVESLHREFTLQSEIIFVLLLERNTNRTYGLALTVNICAPDSLSPCNTYEARSHSGRKSALHPLTTASLPVFVRQHVPQWSASLTKSLP